MWPATVAGSLKFQERGFAIERIVEELTIVHEGLNRVGVRDGSSGGGRTR